MGNADIVGGRLLLFLRMAKKKIQQQVKRTCRECKFGVEDWKHENLSCEGKPILLICPYSIGRKRLMNETACGFFQIKTL